jgi:PhzF family phenazine biosynthesis protein
VLFLPATRRGRQRAPPGRDEALGVEPLSVWRSRFDYLIELADEAAVRKTSPDLRALTGVQARGVMITSRAAAREFDFVSRFFAPSVGVNEDPVTGSAHCALGPFWAERLGRNELVAYQASARGGVVRVRVAGDRVLLGGQAVTVLRGELL